jgi:hypothetical protein
MKWFQTLFSIGRGSKAAASSARQRKPFARPRAAKVLQILTWHVGRHKAIGMGELYESVYGNSWQNRINDTRPLRDVIEKLRRRGVPICSDESGYWLAAAGSELEEFCARLRRRALKSLVQEARLKKIGLPELLGQMQLNLNARALAKEEQDDAAA